jgi:hypothetical protein
MKSEQEENEMTNLRQAAEMALKTLEEINEISKPPHGIPLPGEIDGAMDALRQALAEPEQKPTAYMRTDIEGNPNKFRLNSFGGAVGLYTKEQL